MYSSNIQCSNFAVFVLKALAYRYSGSAAMLSETVHSLADMLNQVCYYPLSFDYIPLHSQCLLALGIAQSIRSPDPDHPWVSRSNLKLLRRSIPMLLQVWVVKGSLRLFSHQWSGNLLPGSGSNLLSWHHRPYPSSCGTKHPPSIVGSLSISSTRRM